MYIRASIAAASASIFLCACGQGDTNDFPTPETENISNIKSVGYTYHADNGNRYVKGQSDLTNITPIDIPLPTTATWIAAAANGLASVWTVVLADGAVKAYQVNGQAYTEVTISPTQLSAPIPPTLVVGDDNSIKLANVFSGASRYSATAILDKTTGDRAYVADNGDVVVKTTRGEQRLAVNALPYARVLLDANQRILVLTSPSTRYDHIDVLGSQFAHASAITLIETRPTLKVVNTIAIAAPDVIEGNALIWEDTNNDGKREIITTLARTGEGARIVVYSEDGTQISASSSIGVSHRWRHQIAVAPFQSAAETSLVSVYIPHIGPNIEYFRLDDASMTRQSQAVDFTSHLSTSLNLDMSITGDFDNDGRIELLLVNRNTRKQLGAFEYQATGIALDWSLPLADAISSNVAAVTMSNNSVALGVGQGRTLRVWQP